MEDLGKILEDAVSSKNEAEKLKNIRVLDQIAESIKNACYQGEFHLSYFKQLDIIKPALSIFGEYLKDWGAQHNLAITWEVSGEELNIYFCRLNKSV